MAVAEKDRRILDCWIRTNVLECSIASNRNTQFCCRQQQDRPTIGQRKGRHSRPIFTSRGQVCRNPTIRHDPFSQCTRIRCHYDLGIDEANATRGATTTTATTTQR